MARATKLATPIHPGEVLLEDFLIPMGISQYRLAKECGLTPRHVNEMVKAIRSITAPTALALGKFFDVDPQWWMNMQARYDLDTAQRSATVVKKIAGIRQFAKVA